MTERNPDCTAPVHGDLRAYYDGCRCPEASRQQVRRMKEYHVRRLANGGPLRVPSLGAQRRIQALAWMGYRRTDVAVAMNRNAPGDQLSNIMSAPSVTAETHERIKALYDRWWDKPGPSPEAAQIARRKGWPPPMAWDDDTIDDPAAKPAPQPDRPIRRAEGRAARRIADPNVVARAVDGKPPAHITARERREALRVLHGLGLSDAQIAARLRITIAAAYKVRLRAGLPANFTAGGQRRAG